MIRCLDDYYTAVYSDIDNTIVYGFMNDLMDKTWKMFHSDFIADILMTLQTKFKLYNINHKLVKIINDSNIPLVFVTARKEHSATSELLDNIITRPYFLVSLRTDNPAQDKVQYILNNQWCNTERFCIFDDNQKVRDLAMEYDIDAFDPTVLYEDMVK